MYDRMDKLALECEISCTVLGRGSESVLIDNSDKDSSYLEAKARANGWTFAGVLGLKDGIPRAECDPHPDSTLTMVYAALAFCGLVADKLHHPVTGDSTNWLRQLYALPDPRF